MNDADESMLPEGVTLRQVDETRDSEFLFALFRHVSRRQFAAANLPEEQLELILNQQFAAQKSRFQQAFPQGDFQLILLDGKPVGQWYSARCGEDLDFELVHATLLSRYRGRGIVAALTRLLAQTAVKQGKRLRAWVEKGNPARQIWFHLGFEVIDDQGTHLRLEHFPKELDVEAMPDGFTLRPARPASDREFLLRLFKFARQRTFSNIDLPPGQLEALVSHQFALFQSESERQYPQAIRYLVIHDGVPVGEWYLDEGDERIYIVNAALLPEYQGRGISATMHRSLFARADREGKPVRSHVEKGNPAVDILVHLGLQIVGESGPYHELEYRRADGL